MKLTVRTIHWNIDDTNLQQDQANEMRTSILF